MDFPESAHAIGPGRFLYLFGAFPFLIFHEPKPILNSQERKCTMSDRGKWIVAVTIVLSLVMLLPAAQAEDPIDFTQYASCTFTPASSDKEFGFFSYECRGSPGAIKKTKFLIT